MHPPFQFKTTGYQRLTKARVRLMVLFDHQSPRLRSLALPVARCQNCCMVLPICEAGEIVLRRPARELTPAKIISPEMQSLIADMFDTMRAAPGVGLAAPQIGLPLQLAVIEDRQEYIDKAPPGHAAARERLAVPPQVIVNPRLTLEKEAVEFFEGCLSLPGFTAVVPRARAVRVDCLNERGEPVTIHARGWYARILQHEIDHLGGTLYIDRMHSRSFMNRGNFELYWKNATAEELRKLLDV